VLAFAVLVSLESTMRHHWYSSAGLLSILLAACGTEVAPIELAPCDLRGTLTPGATFAGHLGATSCSAPSDAVPGFMTDRDRWILQLHPDTVYVVSATYLHPPSGERWAGRLLEYTVEGEDTLLRSGYWGTAGTAKGDLLQEMLLANPTDRTVLVQLERWAVGDSGAYWLEVRRCAILPLTPGVTTPTLALAEGCPLWSAGTPGHARFFSYPSDSTVTRQVTVEQSGGAVPIYFAWAALPSMNFACWYAAGRCDLGAGGTATFVIHPFPVNGVTAGAVFTLGPSASVTLKVETVP
jgi:hypothetical protein